LTFAVDISTSSSAIADTARVTYLLSASLPHWYTEARCADTQDLLITN